MKKTHITLAFGLGLIVTATALLIYGQKLAHTSHFDGKLRDLLPPSAQGWTRLEKSIAETPEMRKTVGELLNYDDGVYVEYESPTGENLSVYLAYWRPGKMSPRLVAGHTPDVCWVANGWRPVARKFGFNIPSVRKPLLPPAQWGVYELKGVTQHVVFWHVHGGTVLNPITVGAPPWWAFLDDVATRGLDQRGEQFFIRLSSSQPVERWGNWTIYRELVSALAPHFGVP